MIAETAGPTASGGHFSALLIAAAAIAVMPAPASADPPPAPLPPTSYPVSEDELGATWRPGCPVPVAQLRQVEVNFIGFDGQTHRGAMVVNADVVSDVIAIFDQLYQLRYPIAKMQTVSHYPGAEDELSMEDNNTSAFNCRPLPGSTAPSQHSYGRAIDVNPLINPYIDSSGDLQPKIWTAAAPIRASFTTATRPSSHSPAAVGTGAATGDHRRTTSTSNCRARGSGTGTAVRRTG
jgi:hypothetical protein